MSNLEATTKGGLNSERRSGFFKLPKMSAENYPGIEKIKILTFFAFTGVIYLQVQQIGSRSIINNFLCLKHFTHST